MIRCDWFSELSGIIMFYGVVTTNVVRTYGHKKTHNCNIDHMTGATRGSMSYHP